MGSQGYTKKRPCGICRRWFMPHPRLKDRQQTCGDRVCKKEWHRKNALNGTSEMGITLKPTTCKKSLMPKLQPPRSKAA